MDQKLVAARTMAQAVQYDPQFVLPERPHFPAELVRIPAAEALLIDGTDELQALRGRATQTFIPRLLSLLDGTRTMQQLVEAFPGISGQAVYNAVSLLYTRGVLEDSAVSPAIDREHCNPETLAFFRRHVDVTRVNRSALQAQARMQEREVIIYTFGPGALEMHRLLSSLLDQAGIVCSLLPAQELYPQSLPDLNAEGSNKKFVVVFVEGIQDRQWLQALDDRCAASGTPWLLATVDPAEQTFELGPYIEHSETACYRCFSRAKRPGSQHHSSTNATAYAKIQTRMALDLLAIEIIYLLSRIAPPATGTNVMRYDLENWTTQRIRFPKLPGCIHCRPCASSQPGEERTEQETDLGWVDTAYIYEDIVAFPSRHLLDPKTHQVHYRPENIELTYEGKAYPNTKQISLPGTQVFSFLAGETFVHLAGITCTGRASATLDIARLSALLLLSAGIYSKEQSHAHKLQRWASTGGNLGSVELYVVALRVNGLEPGIYFYQAFEHTLASLKYQHEPVMVADCMQQIAPQAEQPDALIVGVAAFHRVSHKYGAFGYRIGSLDAGFAFGQMHMAGSSLGLQTRTLADWADDIIASEFALKDMDEMVTGVVAVSGIQ